MSSSVSSEKPKHLVIREVARLMRMTRETGRTVVAVVGPAVVHTGASPASPSGAWGWIDVVFGARRRRTPIGLSVRQHQSRKGQSVEGGHEHHLRYQSCGMRGIAQAVGSEWCAADFSMSWSSGVPYVLAGSIRDDGPLPDVVTDVIKPSR